MAIYGCEKVIWVPLREVHHILERRKTVIYVAREHIRGELANSLLRTMIFLFERLLPTGEHQYWWIRKIRVDEGLQMQKYMDCLQKEDVTKALLWSSLFKPGHDRIWHEYCVCVQQAPRDGGQLTSEESATSPEYELEAALLTSEAETVPPLQAVELSQLLLGPGEGLLTT
ncbi:MAG: hypothetical protein ACREMY_31560 [bacterium]